MATVRRILVPFDFIGPSKRACDYALELAAALDATLCLLHVVERFDIPLTTAEHATILDGARQELEHAARALRPHVREVEALVREGTPWTEIETAARDVSADLIVMGTHGRRGIARALLGSVAAHVLRTSPVPVVTLPEYVAVSRNAAGVRLATSLEKPQLERPRVVALSRGALTVATAFAAALKGSVDFWAVEAVITKDGIVIGAIGEDEVVRLEAVAPVGDLVRQEAVAAARQRLGSDRSALRGARPMKDCAQLDVVLVADGLFSTAYARVAIDQMRKAGAGRIVIASPVVSREVLAYLEGKVDAVVALERSIIADACTYREDVLPSDLVAYELLAASP